MPHISLVFREMWDTTALHVLLRRSEKGSRFVVPHALWKEESRERLAFLEVG